MVNNMSFNSYKYDLHYGLNNCYCTVPKRQSIFSKTFPSVSFYLKAIFGSVSWLCYQAKINKCNGIAWTNASMGIAKYIESVGGTIDINGLEHIDALNKPCIFLANHMSTLETFMLPGIIRPRMPFVIVIKESLVKVPLFGSVLKARKAIAISRTNPRDDLKTVLEEGKKKIDEGISVLIFPQSTRSVKFDPQKFSSIGIKLAKHCDCPVIPIALKTDAWAQGNLIKDFGSIHPERTVHFALGAPIYVQGRGKDEHAQVCNFIAKHLENWTKNK